MKKGQKYYEHIMKFNYEKKRDKYVRSMENLFTF